jgi:hypothetical protein
MFSKIKNGNTMAATKRHKMKATRKTAVGKKGSKTRLASKLGERVAPKQARRRAPRAPYVWGRTKALTSAILDILAKINSPMSTRQVYYQCVSSNAVQATASGYNRVQRLLVDLRRNGTIPRYRIVDRTRAMHQVTSWDSLGDAFASLKQFYRRNLFQTQRVVPIIGMEKDALAGVISDIVDEYGVPLFITRGYPSLALLEDWEDEIRALTDDGKEVRIFYFGDFDPDGVDIPRCIDKELTASGVSFEFNISGLLKSDMAAYKLFSITLKAKGPRTKEFIRIHGKRAAELDALPADVLRQRVRQSIESCIDKKAWDELKKTEQHDRDELDKHVEDVRRAMQRGEEEPDSQNSEE